MPTRIESRQNQRIKELAKLSKRRRRDEQKLTVVEGHREVRRALQRGVMPVEAYISPTLVDAADDEAMEAVDRLQALETTNETRLFEVSEELFARIAYREGSGGLLITVPYLSLDLDGLPQPSMPFYAVVENVEKPGNLGAILRTADAAGVDGILIANSQEYSPTDVHNPNTIRSSLGTMFSVPLAQATTEAAIHWLRSKGIQIVTTSPDATEGYTDITSSQPIAIVMGSEAFGVSNRWVEEADKLVKIPMFGIADSLNLSTAAAIMLYEVVRQRAQEAG